ncbi:MAG: LLM class flavin-dependent oxidoreductase [Acidimicrobiales bacterium]
MTDGPTTHLAAPGIREQTGLGILLTRGTGPVAAWGEAAARFGELDDAGCSVIWLADHLFWGVPMPEALVLAGVAVTATRRCLVGTGVLQLPLREPVAVAKAAATLQSVSGDRFVLGVGSGSHQREYERVGVDFTRRGRILDAGIDQIRAAWADPDDDDWYRQRPTPAPVPIWVGGHSQAALTRAATRADGWMPIFLTAGRYAEVRAGLEASLATAGRPPGAVTMGAVAFTAVTGPGWSRADALDWGARLWGLDPSRLDRYLVAGPAEACAEALRRYTDAGAQHVSLLLATDDPVAMFSHVARAWADAA